MPSNVRCKNNNASQNHKLENASSLMKKLKAAPKYMVDYRTNLETSLFKKKFGLERINEFHKIMNEANIDYKKQMLPKLREKSVKNNCKKLIDPDTVTKKILKKNALKPIDTSLNTNRREKIISTKIKNHMEQLSSILGQTSPQVYQKELKEPMSAQIAHHHQVVENNAYTTIPLKSILPNKVVSSRLKQMQNQPSSDSSPSMSPSSCGREGKTITLGECTPQRPDKMASLDEEQMEDINFIDILMHVDGQANGVSIANDTQFNEICKLMEEYYGISEKKTINKYEVWREYTKNLKMKKKFDERNRKTDITHNPDSEKIESKKDMTNRYTAFLSKKWFANSDPFLKAKYKDYFEDSEVKWGPNMIYKHLERKTTHLNQVKHLVEQRLNKETIYVNNRIKVENYKTPEKTVNNSRKSTSDEDYDKFIKKSHKDMCKY